MKNFLCKKYITYKLYSKNNYVKNTLLITYLQKISEKL